MGQGGGLQGLAPDDRVLLHDLEFFGGQRAGFQQNPVGNAHLADVVQRARHVNQLDVVAVHLVAVLLLQRELIGQHPAILAHALQVRAGLAGRAIRRVSPG